MLVYDHSLPASTFLPVFGRVPILGVRYGACAAMEYLTLEGVSDSVVSLALLSPLGLEPVSSNFADLFGDPPHLARRLADPVYCKRSLQRKLAARPAARPNCHHRSLSAGWGAHPARCMGVAKAAWEAHESGALYRRIELEASGVPLLACFGSADSLAKEPGSPVETRQLRVANENLEELLLPGVGHDLLAEDSQTIRLLASELKRFINAKHKEFLNGIR